MSAHHSAVWIDHHKAHVFQVDPESYTMATIEAPTHVPRHPQGQASPHNHPDDLPRFFRDVITALGATTEFLVIGPSTAKVNFTDFVKANAPNLRVVGTETVDHPTDNQVAAYVRNYFAPSGGASH